uniref:Protein SDA1 n=1 Tax=Romanomermis culicivorax TaxID=13658 RepID=A0A915JA83_ROMCU
MSNRYNSLEHNLAALQDLIKRDAASYRDEFLEQYRHYENTLKLFQLQPDLDSAHLIEVVSFLSHVAHCYPQETKQLSADLIQILTQSGQLLDPHLRMSLCKCLVILRNKGLSDSIEILKLFFELAKCRDKALRKFIFESTVAYAKFLLMKKNCPKLISAIQAFVFSKLNETYAVTCRLALLICIDLYRRRVWQDAKTANMIGRACLHRVTKIYVTACKFFLGKDMFDEKEGGGSSDDDDENKDDGKPQRSIKEIMVGYRAAKKTRKKQKQLEKAKENLQKVESKQKSKSNKLKQLDFSAFHYLYDPQDFVEKLFKKLEKCNDRFEVKIMLMALIARTVGIHKLQLLSFYPHLQKYARPSQRDVTKILLFAAQSTHDLVPPDVVQLLLKTVVNNFISDRCSSEAITVGKFK